MDKTEFLNNVTAFSGNKIKNPGAISSLYLTYSSDKKTFDDLIFTAKYLNGLGRIIHTGLLSIEGAEITEQTQEDSQKIIRKEYKINLEKFISLLINSIKSFPDNEKHDIEKKYLAMDQISMVNLTTLIYDLCWVKKYLNTIK